MEEVTCDAAEEGPVEPRAASNASVEDETKDKQVSEGEEDTSTDPYRKQYKSYHSRRRMARVQRLNDATFAEIDKVPDRVLVLTHSNHKTMSMHKALKSVEKEVWKKADEEEFDRLLNIDGVELVHHSLKPISAMSRNVVKVLENKQGKGPRVRAAINGSPTKGQSREEMYASYSSTPEIKRLFWQLGAIHSKKYGAVHDTLDISSFYLHERNKLDRLEYFYYPVGHMSEEFTRKYREYIHDERILLSSSQAIYGMHDAGSVAGRVLTETLEANEYEELQSSCLWRSKRKGEEALIFQINVDDFGIIHDPGSDQLNRLKSVLDEVKYKFTQTDPKESNKEFCGVHVHHDKRTHEYTITMPGYIDKILETFDMKDCKPEESPYRYRRVEYTKQDTRIDETEDNSELCSSKQVTEVQRKLGMLRWVIDAVMPELQYALSRLACRTDKITVGLLKDVNHLIKHMSTKRNPAIRFKPVAVRLNMFSDASFSSERKSKSRMGGVIFMGDMRRDEELPSAPLRLVSQVTPVVADSAAEAEYLALHAVMKKAVFLKSILEDLGYPQKGSIVKCDNKAATSIANKTAGMKHTKHIRRRFHWIQDQVQLEQYKVVWEKGDINLADYFTKPMNKQDNLKMSHIFGLQCKPDGIGEEGVLWENAGDSKVGFMHSSL